MEDGFAISQAEQPRKWLTERSVPLEERSLLEDSGSDLGERVREALRKCSDGGWHQVQQNINLLGALYGMAEVPPNAVLDIPQDIEYWCKLRKTEQFDAMWPSGLKLQSETLLIHLVGYSNGTFDLEAQDELSKQYSASQNRYLLGRVLHGRNSRPSPPKTDNQQLTFLFGEKSTDFMTGWRPHITELLSLQPPMLDGLSSVYEVLDQVPIARCELIRAQSMIHQSQFPCLYQEYNRLPLFLVVWCRQVFDGGLQKLLHVWLRSPEGQSTFLQLQRVMKTTREPETFMIHVSALAAFKSIENDGVKPSSKRITLKDLHQYLIAEDGSDTPGSLVDVLSNSLCASILTSGSLARFRLMGLYAAECVDVNGIICHYCFQRLNTPTDHQQAMEEIHRDYGF